MLAKKIEVVFSTESLIVAAALQKLGGRSVETTQKTETYYVSFTAEKLFDIFIQWRALQLPPHLGEFGFFNWQLIYQYTLRRIAM